MIRLHQFLRAGAALFAAWVLLAGAMVDAQGKTGPRRKVHVLLIGLTDDKNVGGAVEFNLKQMRELLDHGLADHHRGEFLTLKGPDANGRKILETIDKMAVGADDALFIYFHGHGAYDTAFKHTDPSGGHFMAIPSGDLMRKDLWE